MTELRADIKVDGDYNCIYFYDTGLKYQHDLYNKRMNYVCVKFCNAFVKVHLVPLTQSLNKKVCLKMT